MGKKEQLNRREFFRLGTAGFVAAGSILANSKALAAGNKPNFIIFYTDDQGIGDLSCFGASDFETPNIDALCQSGIAAGV